MKQYSAGYKLGGGYLAVITTVLAENKEAAEKRLEEELKKPGRGHYLQKWNNDGRIVKRKKS